jgi:carbon-monoxide dehydrogenase small subunit
VTDRREIRLDVNGRGRQLLVEDRRTLADVLRDDCALTGTHLGCEHGACGSCTVLLDGEAVRSCLLFASQLDGAEIVTIEGMADEAGGLHPVQEAFRVEHGLQCGFCTPGFVISAYALLRDHPQLSAEQIRAELSGNLCRCTGYDGIVRAVQRAAEQPVPPPAAVRHGEERS